jgi:hypothetical protein
MAGPPPTSPAATSSNCSPFDHNIIPALAHMLETEDFDIRKECAWTISNATSGDNVWIWGQVSQMREGQDEVPQRSPSLLCHSYI